MAGRVTFNLYLVDSVMVRLVLQIPFHLLLPWKVRKNGLLEVKRELAEGYAISEPRGAGIGRRPVA